MSDYFYPMQMLLFTGAAITWFPNIDDELGVWCDIAVLCNQDNQ